MPHQVPGKSVAWSDGATSGTAATIDTTSAGTSGRPATWCASASAANGAKAAGNATTIIMIGTAASGTRADRRLSAEPHVQLRAASYGKGSEMMANVIETARYRFSV